MTTVSRGWDAPGAQGQGRSARGKHRAASQHGEGDGALRWVGYSAFSKLEARALGCFRILILRGTTPRRFGSLLCSACTQSPEH